MKQPIRINNSNCHDTSILLRNYNTWFVNIGDIYRSPVQLYIAYSVQIKLDRYNFVPTMIAMQLN